MKGYRSVFLEIEDIGQEEIFTLKRNFSEDEKTKYLFIIAIIRRKMQRR